MRSLIYLVNDFRALHKLDHKAYVITHDHTVQGFVNDLKDPKKWVPGTYAFDANKNVYVASGGDQFFGARSWNPLNLSDLSRLS